MRIQRSLPEAKRRRLRINYAELLEVRELLVGNITAAFEDGRLLVTGDDEANKTELVQSGDQLLLRGLDGTTVNGLASDFALPATPAPNVEVALGKGPDELLIKSVTLADVSINGGEGAETLTFDTVEAGSVFINSKANGDVISLTDLTTEASIRVVGDLSLIHI